MYADVDIKLLHGGCVVLAENTMLQNNYVHHD